LNSISGVQQQHTKSALTPISDFFPLSEVVAIQQTDSTAHKLKLRSFHKSILQTSTPVWTAPDRKPPLLYEVLTDYTWGKHKVQQSNKAKINKPQYMLFMKYPSIRYEILIVIYLLWVYFIPQHYINCFQNLTGFISSPINIEHNKIFYILIQYI